MRILFLSNFYPPAHLGGYSQWCYEVAEELKKRGHVIGVLTSDLNASTAPNNEEGVYRTLHLEGDLDYYQPAYFFKNYHKHQQENSEAIKQVVREFYPDLIFVWGMWAMSKAVPALVESLCPSRVVYYLSDYWVAATDMHTDYWRQPARHWYTRLIKRILSATALSMIKKDANPSLKLEHVICVSQAVKDILINAGLPVRDAFVIHGGTDLRRFEGYKERNFSSRPLRFLYAGQLVRHKGVHTAIEAYSKLVNGFEIKEVALTVVGWGHPDYEAFLNALIMQEGLCDFVSFDGAVSREDMPALMQNHHALIFPSIYEEPFARLTQEAMLSGMVVLGTTTGGTKEILEDGKNGLTFIPQSPDRLAEQMARLIRDPELCNRLSANGRSTVTDKFTLDRMVDEIEDYLAFVLRLATCEDHQ
jgi:glycosyltransferase involved in cell wall biosynthesis